MSDAAALQAFVHEALVDLGATVSEGGPLLWVHVPATLQSDLDVPATFVLTFDPARTGEWDAELVAAGSYFLEKLVAHVTRRGRWHVARYLPPSEWVRDALGASGLDRGSGVHVDVLGMEETTLVVLAFRVTLLSDEKREALYRIAVSPQTGSAWELNAAVPNPHDLQPFDGAIQPDLERAYRIGTQVLRERCQETVDRFRAASLRLLEEEVRRIFGYFDRTVDEIREADPTGSDDLVRAIQEERDRRLTETLERFDPTATATLCSIMAVVTPSASIRLGWPGTVVRDVTVDAWSRHVAGLVCSVCHGTDGPWRPQEDRGLRCVRCP